MSAVPSKRGGHSAYALSRRTRRVVLNALHQKALSGDTAAMESLIRLGLEFGHDRRPDANADPAPEAAEYTRGTS
jgi:hypothetical protein